MARTIIKPGKQITTWEIPLGEEITCPRCSCVFTEDLSLPYHDDRSIWKFYFGSSNITRWDRWWISCPSCYNHITVHARKAKS